MDRPASAPSLLGQINATVAEAAAVAGPRAVELGRGLLAATNAGLRVAGVAVLSEHGGLTAELLAAVAADADLAVPLNAMGWLADTGKRAQADTLAGSLAARGVSADDVIALMDTGRLNAAGSREALDVLSGSLPADEARVLYASVSEDAAHQYSVRMKAALLMRDTVDFETYRTAVGALQRASSEDDPLWQEGITRLATRLQGPAPVHEATAALTPSDVDALLAREYPMTLEDLAQNLEWIASRESVYVKPGTAAHLAARIAELKKQPWTADQQTALTRVETVAAELPALEAASPSPPSTLPEAPPGAADP
jgi:hypothetical protein